jgi:hypothetical protein
MRGVSVRVSKLVIVIACCVSLLLALPYSTVHSEVRQQGTPTPTNTDNVLFGPETGNLTLPLDFVETGLKLHNFKLNMRFYVPYAPREGNWLLAILFRTKGQEASTGFAVGVASSGGWTLSEFISASEQVERDGGRLPMLKTAQGDYNDLELTIEGDSGTLSMNGQEVATFDLFEFQPLTDKDLLVGVFGSRRGVDIRYEDLTVTSLDGASPSTNITRTPSTPVRCIVTTQRATPLLDLPDRDGVRLLSIPSDRRLEGYAVSSNLIWIKVRYGGQEGWVLSFAVNVGNGCADLPIED